MYWLPCRRVDATSTPGVQRYSSQGTETSTAALSAGNANVDCTMTNDKMKSNQQLWQMSAAAAAASAALNTVYNDDRDDNAVLTHRIEEKQT